MGLTTFLLFLAAKKAPPLPLDCRPPFEKRSDDGPPHFSTHACMELYLGKKRRTPAEEENNWVRGDELGE